ncbi:MAG: Phosphopantetheine adenylyltransferase [Thermoanaerobacterales bacterium 50_218]|nr:MAG: Phosphopantetheine adenylyltransferase [Thermoanaerobacterales bacterium 50_218]HAA90180.1 pantetheine-phosphate adenylyltransferase [Peptococcaceae bacterium]
MKIAVYPGSFDPITYGHLDIIERATLIFDKVIVAVCVNPNKKPLFSMEERMKMIAQECAHLPNVEIKCFRGLLSDFVQRENAQVIIRGLRAISDFENEFQMALVNRKLNPNVETLFLMAHPRYSYLSSSVVKEIASLGGKVTDFVSEQVALQLREKLWDSSQLAVTF